MKKEMLINKIANRLGYNTAYCSEAVQDGMRADVVDFCIEYQDDLITDQPKIDKLIEWMETEPEIGVEIGKYFNKDGTHKAKKEMIKIFITNYHNMIVDKAKEIRDDQPKE